MHPSTWTWKTYIYCLGALLAINFFGPKGFVHLLVLKQTSSRLETQVQEQSLALERLEKEVRLIEKSAPLKEKILREELGYLLAGEYLVEISD